MNFEFTPSLIDQAMSRLKLDLAKAGLGWLATDKHLSDPANAAILGAFVAGLCLCDGRPTSRYLRHRFPEPMPWD